MLTNNGAIVFGWLLPYPTNGADCGSRFTQDSEGLTASTPAMVSETKHPPPPPQISIWNRTPTPVSYTHLTLPTID
jgi:hypothetical protein